MKQLLFELGLNEKVKNDKINERVEKLNNSLKYLLENIESFIEFEKTLSNDKLKKTQMLHEFIPSKIDEIRKVSDEAESIISRENWNILLMRKFLEH